MGDREEQTVRVRPPRAGPGSRGWGVWAKSLGVSLLISPSKWGQGLPGSSSNQMGDG